MRTTTSSGKIGEKYAVDLLKRKGYKILFRNFRSKFGEIDIIAKDPSTLQSGSGRVSSGQVTLVFIEVKTRWSKRFGQPEEAVTPTKLRHLEKAAYYFKLLNPKTPDLMRIDVVATEVENGKVTNAKIIKNVTGF